MTLLRTTLLSSLLATVVLGASAAPRTEVIPLNYRTADDVMAVAQSVIGSEGKVTAYGNQLIVNAEPAKIRELQSVLQQIDSRPHRLLITVDTSENLQQDSRGYSVDGSASAGNIEIQSGRGEVNGKDRVRIIRRSTDSRSGGSQQVQATEGYPALIQVGQSVPITSTATGPYGQIYSQTEYRNVNRGFYVTATLTGNLVHVTISSSNDRLSREPSRRHRYPEHRHPGQRQARRVDHPGRRQRTEPGRPARLRASLLDPGTRRHQPAPESRNPRLTDGALSSANCLPLRQSRGARALAGIFDANGNISTRQDHPVTLRPSCSSLEKHYKTFDDGFFQSMMALLPLIRGSETTSSRCLRRYALGLHRVDLPTRRLDEIATGTKLS